MLATALKLIAAAALLSSVLIHTINTYTNVLADDPVVAASVKERQAGFLACQKLEQQRLQAVLNDPFAVKRLTTQTTCEQP